MGWKCNNCGNTESFMEINKVATLVSQEEGTTKIKKILNKYMDNPLLNVRCSKCGSEHVEFIDIPNQDNDHLFQQEKYVTENYNINTIVFELTNKCDLNCVYCPKKENKELDFDLIKRIIEENIKLKNPIIHFELGWDMGNPLLHSEIKKIIDIFNSFDCKVNILTNGKNFINNVKDLNLTDNLNFTFFLDCTTQKENDKLMGKDVFSNTLKAFDYLRKKNISFNVYMRLSKCNYDKINGMNKFIKKYGGNNLVPTEIYPLGKTKDDILMNDEMKEKAIKDIESSNLNKSIHFSPAMLYANCTYQRNLRLFINSRGKLSFCHFLSSLPNSDIVDIRNKHLLELIQINNKVRQGFLKNKRKLFTQWKKPRQSASPCSYCLHAFGLNKKW